jgi:hypothetical protein
MSAQSDEALSKTAKDGRTAASNQFSARFVRSYSWSRCAGETARKLQRPRASMQAGVTGTTTMTVRVRP